MFHRGMSPTGVLTFASTENSLTSLVEGFTPCILHTLRSRLRTFFPLSLIHLFTTPLPEAPAPEQVPESSALDHYIYQKPNLGNQGLRLDIHKSFHFISIALLPHYRIPTSAFQLYGENMKEREGLFSA